MRTKSEKRNGYFSSLPHILFTILSAAAVGITLLVLPFSHSQKSASSALPTALPVLTPSPTAMISSVDIMLPYTPAPESPAAEYPEGAMDLVVNGTVVCTLPSGEEAAALPEKYLAYWAEQPLEDNEFLVSARIEAKLAVTEPSGQGTLLSEEEALLYLERNPSLLPVSRTLRTVDIEETILNDQQTVSPLLPPGMTVIRKLERPSYMLYYTDREYEGLTLLSKTTAAGFLIGSAATGRIIETGAEPDTFSEPTPSPAPGELADKTGVSLSLPVKGTIASLYGRDEKGTMHYGIDFRSEAGYAVYAPGEGIIVYCGKRGNLGNVIEIRHDDSGYISRLIGLDGDISLELYQRIKKSDRLGKVAATPDRSKPVFRFELLKDGIPVDPLPYLK